MVLQKQILIATTNPHKFQKIQSMFKIGEQDFEILSLNDLNLNLNIDENEDTFEKNAVLKAREYSKHFDGLVVSTDGGIVIPTLPQWNPLYTRRFAGANLTDEGRISKILEMMKNKKGSDRSMHWQEAIAICKNGKRLFSLEVKGIKGKMDKVFDPSKYKEGIWLCSIWSFPQFGNKNFFDLTTKEQLEAEISWAKLGVALRDYINEHNLFD
jgi:non-canonical purine NTP pyrophosphatase (RdgB/HAM1 family)